MHDFSGMADAGGMGYPPSPLIGPWPRVFGCGAGVFKVDRFYPSSQLCSDCGYRNKDTKDLHIREWTCPDCGVWHDRDVNAATNIMHETRRLMQER